MTSDFMPNTRIPYGILMPARPISSALRSAGLRAMNFGHKIVAMPGRQRPVRPENDNASAGDFWPEVSSHYSPEELAQAASENSPGRVVLGVLLVLGIAGLTAVVAMLWVPILS